MAADWSDVMRTTGLSELIIKAGDVERVAAFYRDVVGLTPDESAPTGAAWFWTGEPGTSARFAISDGRAGLADLRPFTALAPVPAEERAKMAHFAFQVPDDQLDDAVADLKAQGIPVSGPIELGWMAARACYFWDPEGHLVEFWSPREEGAGIRD